MMGYGSGSGGWVSWLLMLLVMLAVVAGTIALMVWGLRRDPESADPAVLLKKRFARGEIDAQELASRLEVLAKN